MKILDSRRLTGPSLLLDGPGAVLDVSLHGLDPTLAIDAWRAELALLLDGVGWSRSAIAARAHAVGATLAFTAPIDALYAATEVNEAAWHAATRRLGGGEVLPDARDDADGADRDGTAADGDEDASPEGVMSRLRVAIDAERRPELLRLADAARAHGVTLLTDDKRVSIGLGAGSRAWPVEDTAALADRLPWDDVRDIPVVLVTGTNGKTTTVRLLGAMATAAGLTAGITTTDRVTVGDDIVAVGDYSGPNGARTVLRDRRVAWAGLEVARGGILRRGLPLPRVDVAVVTNVADDHLGEFGIFDVAALADAKLVVAKAVAGGGALVLNADDPLLLERAPRLEARIVWFTLDAAHPAVGAHVAAGGEATWLDGDALMRGCGAERATIARVGDVPVALGGAARHNVANALAAIAAGLAMGLPPDSVTRGLAAFDNTPAHNPGRANVWSLGGVTVIVDFAHNPHGLVALSHMAATMPARRRAVVVGQAGDRDDEAIRAFARGAWAMRPARVFIKDMELFHRGRARGEVPALIEAELRRLGAARDAIQQCASELEAVHAALAWADDDDLLLLTTHAQRDDVIALVERLAAGGWRPGQPLGLTAS